MGNDIATAPGACESWPQSQIETSVSHRLLPGREGGFLARLPESVCPWGVQSRGISSLVITSQRQIVFPTARPGPPSRTLTTTAYSSRGPAACSPLALLPTAVGVNLGQSRSYPMFPLHGAMAPMWLRVEATMPMATAWTSEDLPPLPPCSPVGQLPPCCPVPTACRDPSPPRPPLSSCNTFFRSSL